MKIPRKVRIRKTMWKVSMNDDIEHKHNAVGMCNYKAKEIILSPNQPRNELEETFLHEILHACWPETACSQKLEEKIIGEMSPVLFEVLKKYKLF